MARKSAVLREKRREQRIRGILEAALVVFSEKGYPKATMEEIAEKALLSRVALYRYFRDKETILKELLAWKVDELTAEFATIIASGSRGFDLQVRRLVDAAISFQKHNRGIFHALLTANSLPNLTKDERLMELKDNLINIVADAFQAGIEAGEARREPPRKLAELFFSLLFTPAVKELLEPNSEDLYDGRLIEEVFLRGVATR